MHHSSHVGGLWVCNFEIPLKSKEKWLHPPNLTFFPPTLPSDLPICRGYKHPLRRFLLFAHLLVTVEAVVQNVDDIPQCQQLSSPLSKSRVYALKPGLLSSSRARWRWRWLRKNVDT